MAALRQNNLVPFPIVTMALAKISTDHSTPCIEQFMAAHGTRQIVKAGAIIFLEGDDADALYHVASGVVRCCRITPDGRRQISRFLAEGDEMGMTAYRTFGYTAEAVSEVVLYRCSRALFDRSMHDDPELRDAAFEHMAETLNSSRDQLVLLGQLTAAERAASFLLEMAERLVDASGEIHLPMTRQDIADYLGMTLETVSRMFNKLKKCGVIDMPTPDRIVVRDYGALEDLAAVA